MLEVPAVAAGRRILDRYNAAGGGLLAGGLAYAALLSIVSAVLLLAGVVGLIFDDPVERARAADVIVAVLPPLRDLIAVILADASAGAAPLSILGAVGLAWSMSRFVLAFETSVAMVMGGRPRGSMVRRNLAALIAVIVMV